jgi:ACS family hexuronate transporter-like MFS transporter
MKIRNFRWWIAGLLAVITAINYLDRQNFPLVYVEIKKVIPISDSQYGFLNSLFLFMYGTMYAVGGRIVDLVGTKIGYALMVVWWSLSNIFHSFVSSITGFGIGRFFLGAGEGGGFPASAKVVSEWFPRKERSYAFGIFNTGSSIGAIIAPVLVFLIVDALGSWRWTFAIFGIVGLLWVIVWLKTFSLPDKSKYITEKEKKYILDDLTTNERQEQAGRKTKVSWKELLKVRQLWGLLIIKFLTDSAWFFFIFWLPKYLNDVRGLDIQGVGTYAWIPYAFAGLGSFVGGWLSSYLIKRQVSLDLSRKIALGISSALLPASLLITSTSSLLFVIFFFGLAMMGHQFWSTIVQTLAVDIFPSKIVGTVSGLMGCIGTYGAMIFSLIIGFVIQHEGYTSAFIISGVLHPISFVLVFIILKKIEPVRLFVFN